MTLEIRHLHKSYGDVEVLHGVDLRAEPGDVVAVAGANGAGKSTLMKVLAGAERMSSGEVLLDGEPLDLSSPQHAMASGIRTVYQELSLVPDLTVTENILMGLLPRRAMMIDWVAAHQRAQGILDDLGFTGIHGRQRVGDLTVARQQMVEIAKALATKPRVLVLDEPSAVLAGRDLESLFGLIRRLAAQRVIVLYVSHRLAEVLDIATSIVVMRDGLVVNVTAPDDTDEDELITQMSGRRVERVYPDRERQAADVLLSVRGLTRDREFHDVDLDLHAGEIVGLFGLVGAGRSELARCLFGATNAQSGRVQMAGKPMGSRTPARAIRAGMALVTEDRKSTGIVPDLSVGENIGLTMLYSHRRGPFLDRARRRRDVRSMVDSLDIKPSGCEAMPIGHLSGGNQQKAVLAKWILTAPKVLLLDEPTRGVDMAARVSIYRTIDELARAGHAILLISSDLTEVIGATDRLLVMSEGKITGEMRSDIATEDSILSLAIGKAA